jgi:hypothetical protein
MNDLLGWLTLFVLSMSGWALVKGLKEPSAKAAPRLLIRPQDPKAYLFPPEENVN